MVSPHRAAGSLEGGLRWAPASGERPGDGAGFPGGLPAGETDPAPAEDRGPCRTSGDPGDWQPVCAGSGLGRQGFQRLHRGGPGRDPDCEHAVGGNDHGGGPADGGGHHHPVRCPAAWRSGDPSPHHVRSSSRGLPR